MQHEFDTIFKGRGFLVPCLTYCFYLSCLKYPAGTNSKTKPSVGCGIRTKYHFLPLESFFTYCIPCLTYCFYLSCLKYPAGTNSKTKPSVGCGIRTKYHFLPLESFFTYCITSTTASFLSTGNIFACAPPGST